MDKTLWFASRNIHKIQEVQKFLAPKGYLVKSLLDLPNEVLINENGISYEENALIKANTLAQITNQPAIGDDTGLEILALDNFPGLYSERWKGSLTFHQAMENILEQMSGITNRQAAMVTALAYVDLENNINKVFLGKLEGEIADTLSENNDGFGYDQIFYVPSKHATLYQMGPEEKNKISHRSQVLMQLVNFLQQLNSGN